MNGSEIKRAVENLTDEQIDAMCEADAQYFRDKLKNIKHAKAKVRVQKQLDIVNGILLMKRKTPDTKVIQLWKLLQGWLK